MLHRRGRAPVLRSHFPLPFYSPFTSNNHSFLTCQMRGPHSAAAQWDSRQPKGMGALGRGESICFTPKAKQPVCLVSTMSSFCSSALRSTLRGAAGSQICLEKLSADSIQPHMGKGGEKRQETQGPRSSASLQLALCLHTAFFMRIQVIRQKSSGQESQPSPTVRKEVLCLCGLW